MEQQAQRDSIQNNEQQEFLRREGWKVVRHKNGDTYAKSGEYYTGLRERQYLDTWSRDNTMEYEVEKTEKSGAGHLPPDSHGTHGRPRLRHIRPQRRKGTALRRATLRQHGRRTLDGSTADVGSRGGHDPQHRQHRDAQTHRTLAKHPRRQRREGIRLEPRDHRQHHRGTGRNGDLRRLQRPQRRVGRHVVLRHGLPVGKNRCPRPQKKKTHPSARPSPPAISPHRELRPAGLNDGRQA